MAANAYIKSFTLGSPAWTRLADVPTVLQATIIADPKNVNPINLRFRGGPTAKWSPGAAAALESVDVSEIEAQGGPNHKLLLAGYSPGHDPRGRAAVRLRTLIAYDTAADPVGGGETQPG